MFDSAAVPFTLAEVEMAVRSAFSSETCAADDLDRWSVENRARGHCAVAALTINDLFGGQLLLAKVYRDGEQIGYHYWNRLDGLEIDLTRGQFSALESVGPGEVVRRPPGSAGRYTDQYELFRTRVFAALGLGPGRRNRARPEQTRPSTAVA